MNKSWRNVVIGDETPVEKKAASNSGAKVPAAAGNSPVTFAAASKTSTPLATVAPVSNPSSPTPSASSSGSNDKKRHERLLVVYSPLLGNRVTVFLYDGAVFEGTLDSFETENEFALILRMATMMRPGREVIDPSIKAGVTFELMNIRFDDMAELKAANNSASNGGIGTDAAISKKKGDFGKERELHRWTPETEDVPTLNTSDDSNTQWDQFATNEKLFGLKTDFNEELYTTKLDRNSAHIRANEANAERIAKEIMMASTGGNVHLAEERGQKLEGCEDEEMLYGAVVRDDKSGINLPPGFSKNKEELVTKSTLNPAAPEFKLNIDAPEFIPSADTVAKVTYYNQQRRNLNYGYNYGYQGVYPGGYYPQGGYPQSVPYYYVPPVANFAPAVPVASESALSVTATEPAATATTTSSSSQSQMNPNAADFVMPQYFMPPPPQHYHQYQQYHQQPYYYQGQQGGGRYQGYNQNNNYNQQ